MANRRCKLSVFDQPKLRQIESANGPFIGEQEMNALVELDHGFHVELGSLRFDELV